MLVIFLKIRLVTTSTTPKIGPLRKTFLNSGIYKTIRVLHNKKNNMPRSISLCECTAVLGKLLQAWETTGKPISKT